MRRGGGGGGLRNGDRPGEGDDVDGVERALAEACSEPALPTLVIAPPEMERRALTVCIAALNAMVAATATRYPDADETLRASRWAWVMPTLLLRRPRPALCASGGRQEWAAPDEARATEADVSLTQTLRHRLQLAEMGMWRRLLDEYIEDREVARCAAVRAESAPPKDDDADVFDRVTQRVLGDTIARAKHELLGQPCAVRNTQTADEIAALACVPVDEGEAAALQEELAAADAMRVVARKPTRRMLRRRMVTLRAGAAPGPSGWRNSHI